MLLEANNLIFCIVGTSAIEFTQDKQTAVWNFKKQIEHQMNTKSICSFYSYPAEAQ